MGLVMVYILFWRHGDRDLDFWTPSQRILENIRTDSAFLASERLLCFTKCLELDSASMQGLWKESRVKTLTPGGAPYKYLISLQTEKEHLEATVIYSNYQHRLLSLKSYTHPRTCDCDQ